MTYFGFLLYFLVSPIAGLCVLHWLDRRAGRSITPSLRGASPALLIGLHCVIAVVWTTPWDNYLVATEVWWYDPKLVCGVILGWVPLEEYCFFVLQPIMTGMLLIWLARRLKPLRAPSTGAARVLRWMPAVACGLIVTGCLATLAVGYERANYLCLKFSWALPPIVVQLAFGGDILWRHRLLVGVNILLTTSYLTICDAAAIREGTWSISPTQTFGVILPPGVPLEECVFFLLTNVLVTFGVTLGIAKASWERVPSRVARWLAESTHKMGA